VSRAASALSSRLVGRTVASGDSRRARRSTSLELARNALTSASASRPVSLCLATASTSRSWTERATPQSASARVTPIAPASTREATEGSRFVASARRLVTHSSRLSQSVAIARGPSFSSTRSAWTTRASSMGETVRSGAFARRSRARVAARVLANGAFLKFSRDDELEADRVGLQMLTRAGYIRDPDFVNPAPWLDACLTPICGAVGGAGLAALTPEAAWFFGPAGPAFGHPAFGAASRGALNVGRTPLGFRAGFGRFQQGIAQFRLGVMNWKLDVFGLNPPRGGAW